MALYCGIDLHSNNHVVSVIDDSDTKLVEKKLDNDIRHTLDTLAPYRDDLTGVAVESTFNWYWLVDGLQDNGFPVKLVNPAAVKQYEGLKHTDDKYDAWYLAHLMRLNILPTGHIYPKQERAVRDLLRRRSQLVHMRAQSLISLQSLIWRVTGKRISSNQLRQAEPVLPLHGDHLYNAQALVAVMQSLGKEIDRIEKRVTGHLSDNPSFRLLQTMTGIGPILAMSIVMETGDIQRFDRVGQYASYARCVKSEKTSNGKKKGEGNRKSGNKYLSWAWSEASHFAVRFSKQAHRFYERKKRKTNGIVAIRATAHKLARAGYYVMKRQEPYDESRLFV